MIEFASLIIIQIILTAMKQGDEIWQSIRLMQKPPNKQQSLLEQTRVSENSSFIQEEKENVYKIKECSCQSQQKMIQLKRECLVQIRELKAQQQLQIEHIEKKHQDDLSQLRKHYEEEIASLQEEIENLKICGDQGFNEKQTVEYFDREQERDREMFKKQLDHYVQLTINLERDLDAARNELKRYQTSDNSKHSIQQSIHKNCASQLYRDTNRKVRINTDTDRSTLYEDSGVKTGFCNSIKNFNANVKLIEKSIKHI